MKQVTNDPGFEVDPDGKLFDPRTRSAMAEFAAGEDTLTLEAAGAVRSAFHATERLRARGAAGRGLSGGALDVLIRLSAATENRMSMSELAQAAGVSPRNVTGLVDTLERDGLAERIRAETDRRSVLAQMTPAGQAWMDAFRRPTQVAMAAVFRGFTPIELIQLRHLCLRLVENHRLIDQHLTQAGDPLVPEPADELG